jgi:formaldehyde-activating enzyme involved in methanogenesis
MERILLRQIAFDQCLEPPCTAAEQPLAVLGPNLVTEQFTVLVPELPGRHLLQGGQFPAQILFAHHVTLSSILGLLTNESH